MSEPLSTKILEPHIPKYVVCPYCGLRQPFVKETQYWRTVKAPHLKHPLVLKIRMVCAKGKNPDGPHESFTLPLPGVQPYQRATQTLISEAVAGIIQDNSTLNRTALRLSRTLNTTGSKSTLDRWKKRLASKYEFPEILSQLQFSGALSIDEYRPRRGGRYEQIAGDALKIRILYIEPVPWFYGRGVTEKSLRKLQHWEIHPYCVIFDLWTTFPKVIRKLWPHASLQSDHFHVMQRLWSYLKNALIQFRKSLQGKRWAFHREELWEMKWGLLKHMDRWSEKDHPLIPEMIEIYKGTAVEKILLFKEELWSIFNLSKTKTEAITKRNILAKENGWQDSWHLKKCMDFLMSPKFNLMITYLEDPRIPRSGHSETLINVRRQMETVRRGFKTHQGRLNHLKLFQITHYLKQPL